jgi:hypothetical protein
VRSSAAASAPASSTHSTRLHLRTRMSAAVIAS